MTLSIVIPVRNDPDGLTRLLGQLRDLSLFDAIIVSDDASDVPCRPSELGFDEEAMAITYLRSDAHLGAGHARNLAIAALDTDHVLFFDSDDVLCDPITDLVAHITAQDQDFDFCMFRHIDSRMRKQDILGPMHADQHLWNMAGVCDDAPSVITADQAAHLALVAAYPWNKLYRAAFLRDQNIRCTEIQVHNDIELHWTSFLKADRILVSNLVCCEHFVAENGGRLTNRTGAERLHVFDALDPLHGVMRERANEMIFLIPMAEFYIRLFDWILSNLEDQYQTPFRQRAARFLLDSQTEATMGFIAARHPDLAHRINAHIRGGWA